MAPTTHSLGRVADAQFLNLARDGVAADAELLRRVDAPAARAGQRGANELRFDAVNNVVPHVGFAAGQPLRGFSLQALQPIGRRFGGERGAGRGGVDDQR